MLGSCSLRSSVRYLLNTGCDVRFGHVIVGVTISANFVGQTDGTVIFVVRYLILDDGEMCALEFAGLTFSCYITRILCEKTCLLHDPSLLFEEGVCRCVSRNVVWQRVASLLFLDRRL